MAAAVACGADTVITTNTKDFPPTATTSYGITAKSPDEFLVSLLGPDTRDAALAALRNHAEFHGWPVPELLDLLGSAGPRGPRDSAQLRATHHERPMSHHHAAPSAFTPPRR
jgi:hypothetical protein